MKTHAASALFAGVVLFGPAWAAGASDYKHVNPSPQFKPIPEAEALVLAPEKLGKEPALSAAESRDLASGEVVTRPIPHDGAGKRYESFALIKATPPEVMKVLKDYAHFTEIMPNLSKVEYTWDGNLAHVREVVKVGLFKFDFWVTLMHYGDSCIEWEYDRGDLRDTTGYYKMFPREGGAATLLIYHVYSDPGMALPGFIIDLLSKSSMPKVLKAVRTEVSRRNSRDGGK
ncbi:MAG: SRPBCC family protein [Myxococcota bacterium]|jgi:hypothetical protein